MSEWKDHKMVVLLNEFPKPILRIWFFIKELVKYIFQLFCISWKSMCSVVNKNFIIPSFIGASAILMIINLYGYINSKFGIFPSNPSESLIIFIIMSLLPIVWMFSVIASIRKSKDSNGDYSWKKHLSIGFHGIKFFLTYSVFIVSIIIALLILGIPGFLPQIDQVLLSLLSPAFFAISIILILSIIGLLLGSTLFGGYYLSGDFNDSASFVDKTKSLFLMMGRKLVDWLGISIPGFLVSGLFVLIPFLLTITALEIMRVPAQSYGVGIPGLQLNHKYELESKDFHVKYPDDYEVKSMKQQFKFKKHELQMMQNQYDESGESTNLFLEDANERSWGAKWYLDDNGMLAFEESDDWTEERWVVENNSINYFENGEKKWVSGIDGEIRFVGDYHYSFFIVVTEIILVFINSLILAFPMSFFFASLGSIYYSMYNTDFKINVLKRIIGIVLLIMAINVGYSCLLDILNTLMI